jgi:hypothetical protein
LLQAYGHASCDGRPIRVCSRPLTASTPALLQPLAAPEARRSGVPRQTGTM